MIQTMHLALPVGAFDWEGNPLSEEIFRARLEKLRDVMVARDWSGIIVFGDIPQNGVLTYVSNFAPRLSPAFALLPRRGEPRILSLDGGRMVPAGLLTTWIKDVRAAPNVPEALNNWLTELGGEPRLGLAGFELMPAGLYDAVLNLPGFATAENAGPAISELTRRKSPEELGIIHDNSSLFRKIVELVKLNQIGGMSVVDNALEAEREARNLGAQDVRCLYSPDGGVTFLPFQKLSDEAADTVIFYLAIRRFGYWIDGFVTAGNKNPVQTLTEKTLQNVIKASIAGTTSKALCETRNQVIVGYDRHPMLREQIGAGIGVSLEETPVLGPESEIPLAEGDIISLKIGISDAAGEWGFASALVQVSGSDNNTLWSSY